jgi:hypothetical protein
MNEGSIFVFKRAFEQHIRKITKDALGVHRASKLTEIEFIRLLAQPQCDACEEWKQILLCLRWGLKLTPFKRKQALAYWNAAGQLVSLDLRFPSDQPPKPRKVYTDEEIAQRKLKQAAKRRAKGSGKKCSERVSARAA